MAKLFGFSIENNPAKKPKGQVSPVPPNTEDGQEYYPVAAGGYYGSYVDFEGNYKTEIDLILRYRDMAITPEADEAIEMIINEAIVTDLNDSPVEISLANLNASDSLKTKIREEFKNIKAMLDFDKRAHEIFRAWYVDGRICYHKVIDLDRPNDGIKEIRYIDPIQLKSIKRYRKPGDKNFTTLYNNQSINVDQINIGETEEYYIYTEKYRGGPYGASSKGQPDQGIKLTKDSVAFITSGLADRVRGMTLSYLHKAIRALNQLKMMEDSIVIYRITRAPERRIFYIDVGNLPKVKAEQYLRDTMARYRNKLVYNSTTGEIKDDRRFLSMLEDFWLPRREGGRGTEITTLQGGQNLGELSDVNYFAKKLYKALNVPTSRLEDNSTMSLGRSSEILRDELLFSKFVGRLRKRFSNLFHDLLKTQLLLKNIVSPEDWEKMSEYIQYDYLYDNHFADLKNDELLLGRLDLLARAEPYVGKYFSVDYVRREILHQTDEQIIDIDEQISKEIELGVLPDPNVPVDPNTGLPIEGAGVEGEPGEEEVPVDPSTGQPTVADQTPANQKGGLGKKPMGAELKPPKGGVI